MPMFVMEAVEGLVQVVAARAKEVAVQTPVRTVAQAVVVVQVLRSGALAPPAKAVVQATATASVPNVRVVQAAVLAVVVVLQRAGQLVKAAVPRLAQTAAVILPELESLHDSQK